MCTVTQEEKLYNKNCLFDANFFEFEEFTIDPFFVVAFSLSILWLIDASDSMYYHIAKRWGFYSFSVPWIH